ncbi:MAG: cysteine--tRNA ligase [Parcubacteria group bacterium RIFCSPLOWO2_01_FULL_48_18]|nr:MAG: cysteine--tRNA ligase [Parcubacteria group bacterium RIFCSPLOWO2_01_FULL_48_18]
MIKVYNTLTDKKEPLPKTGVQINMFVCGPTVYDYSHIGHARTYIAFDIIARYLRSRGFKLFYLQNITDVDDKIIERARRERKHPLVFARTFEKAYYKDMKLLGVRSVTTYARASDHISQIVTQIQTLVKKRHAYLIEGGGYYFDLKTFPEYGKLSRRTTEQAEDALTRIDEHIKKRNRGDFCLWKFPAVLKNPDAYEHGRKKSAQKKALAIIDGEPAWWTLLGWGRPGWHIEDTAITEKYFGPQYDIHGGGVDLKFPHHEAEIAQQESASGKKPFVKIWMHTGFLLAGGEKMSKSLGNFITIKDFLKRFPPPILRCMIASVHYRSPFDYSGERATQAEATLEHIRTFLARLNYIGSGAKHWKLAIGNSRKSIPQLIKKYRLEFFSAMDDDFNTPLALGAIFNLINQTETALHALNKASAKKTYEAVNEMLEVLGIAITIERIPRRIISLAKKREERRKNREWSQADDIRKRIQELGYNVEDTMRGPIVFKTRGLESRI